MRITGLSYLFNVVGSDGAELDRERLHHYRLEFSEEIARQCNLRSKRGLQVARTRAIIHSFVAKEGDYEESDVFPFP